MIRVALALCFNFVGPLLLAAQVPAPATSETGLAVASRGAEEAREIEELVRGVVLKHLPHEYENTKQWGGTKQVWDGLRIWRDGLRIKTKRRKKAVNYGTWKRYRAWLIDPGEELRIDISPAQKLDRGRVAFRLSMVAQLGTFGRLSHWRRDIQLISVSANAKAKVRLTLDCELGSELDFTHLPPDVLVVPRVRAAQLDLLEFRLERLSDLSGPLAKELGESLHDVLQDEINQRRGKLVERINRQLENKQEDLRFSVRELSTRGWSDLLTFLRIADEQPDPESD